MAPKVMPPRGISSTYIPDTTEVAADPMAGRWNRTAVNDLSTQSHNTNSRSIARLISPKAAQLHAHFTPNAFLRIKKISPCAQ